MSRKQIVCTFLILSVTFTGCSVKFVGRNYDGPDLPESEIGIIIFKESGTPVLGGILAYKRQSVVLCKVDGKRIDMDSEKRSVSILPGKHTVLFIYDGKRPLVAVQWTFNIEAGHKYLIAFQRNSPIQV
jgi:hypothetical protein